jgi:hypothetical protein
MIRMAMLFMKWQCHRVTRNFVENAFLGRMFCWKFSSGERLSAGRFVKQAFYRTYISTI